MRAEQTVGKAIYSLLAAKAIRSSRQFSMNIKVGRGSRQRGERLGESCGRKNIVHVY